MSVKSDSPSRPGGCSWRKMTSRSAPLSARQARMRRSSVRRMPAPISGWRRRISSKMATGRRPGVLFSSGTTSLSQTAASGSRRRRSRGAFFCDGSRGSCFDAIGGGGAEPGLGRGDDRRLGLAETHVQPHLAIGDVAAGQGRFLIGVKNPLPIRPAATASQRAPCGAAPFAGFATSVGLRPPSVTHPATLSHPD